MTKEEFSSKLDSFRFKTAQRDYTLMSEAYYNTLELMDKLGKNAYLWVASVEGFSNGWALVVYSKGEILVGPFSFNWWGRKGGQYELKKNVKLDDDDSISELRQVLRL